jgi:hypothetical protein
LEPFAEVGFGTGLFHYRNIKSGQGVRPVDNSPVISGGEQL